MNNTVKFCSLSKLKSNSSPINILATRGETNKINNVVWMQELSPSWDRRNEIVNNPEEGLKRFKKDVLNTSKVNIIKMIIDEILPHSDVTVMCYCGDFNKCHISVLADIFEDLGAKVERII